MYYIYYARPLKAFRPGATVALLTALRDEGKVNHKIAEAIRLLLSDNNCSYI